MKNSIAGCLLLFFLGSVYAQKEGVEIEVQIVNIDSDQGQILVGLYDAQDTWLKKIYKGAYGKIKNGTATATFKDVPKGEYAISVFHDENNNGELDMVLGVFPKESTGSSNDAPARFGPPKWEDAKFEVRSENVKQLIHL